MSIELRNISKRFGDVAAVQNVSFKVAEGELVALLGPSGGGKTTVLRMIAGLEQPTEGDILIRGQRVNDVSVQKRNIGFVFQGYALFKTMSVADNIAFGLKIKKWPQSEINDRVAELLKLFGGKDGAAFLDYLNENFYDLHYAPMPQAQPFYFGQGNLWRIALEYPDSPVPPCIHRAPDPVPGQPPRLLLIS